MEFVGCLISVLSHGSGIRVRKHTQLDMFEVLFCASEKFEKEANTASNEDRNVAIAIICS